LDENLLVIIYHLLVFTKTQKLQVALRNNMLFLFCNNYTCKTTFEIQFLLDFEGEQSKRMIKDMFGFEKVDLRKWIWDDLR